MSYIVPNSNKPVRCNRCPFIDADSLNCTLMEDSYKYIELACQHIHCPLIEIHRPHGRLIDADKLNMHNVSFTYGFCVMGVTAGDIESADTVIEAEGET